MNGVATTPVVSPASRMVLTCGWMLSRDSHLAAGESQDGAAPLRWLRHAGRHQHFIERNPLNSFAANSEMAVWIGGYAEVSKAMQPRGAAELVLEHYQRTNALPIDELEGSFIIALHDARKERVLIYRNIAGSVNLFYAITKEGLLYSTNVAQLLKSCPESRRINQELLPLFFLYRCLPGRETFFQGIKRVMPGDLLKFEPGMVNHDKIRTFDDFRGTVSVDRDVVGQVDDTLGAAVQSCVAAYPSSAILLSGGVDSTLLLSHWNQRVDPDHPHATYCATLDHPRTRGEFAYAKSAADYLNSKVKSVPIDRPYLDYLDAVIRDTAETPNHVQAAYFPALAETMHEDGITTGICGEAADGLFGVATQDAIHIASRLRKYLPIRFVRNGLKATCFGNRGSRWAELLELSNHLDDVGYLFHPVNQQASFAHLESVLNCFGQKAVREAMEYRRSLITASSLNQSQVEWLHGANLLTSSINSASYWNTLCETRGVQLLSPFLDSRVIRIAMSIGDDLKYQFRKPKWLLKEALSRRTTSELAYRKKLSFGQPIFEWMDKGGQLRSAVDQIDRYDFVDAATLSRAKAEPNWFLYNLLCFDRLNKAFP